MMKLVKLFLTAAFPPFSRYHAATLAENRHLSIERCMVGNVLIAIDSHGCPARMTSALQDVPIKCLNSKKQCLLTTTTIRSMECDTQC